MIKDTTHQPSFLCCDRALSVATTASLFSSSLLAGNTIYTSSPPLSLLVKPMEDDMKRRQIPAFGNWDFCDQVPITRYFESAAQAGLVRGHYFYEDVDLFKLPEPTKPAYRYHSDNNYRHHRKPRKGAQGKQPRKEQQRKQRSVSDVTAQATPKRPRAPKAVDEDLYKIPPELLYQRPRRKRLLGSFWSGCLGLGCIP